MKALLRLDRGTLVMKERPEAVSDFFQWDARSQSYRARGQDYRDIVEALWAAQIPFKDDAAQFQKLELDFSREIQPYPHQQQALNAWKRAGRRGVVEVPTGGGKTLIAQLALRDTPRSALIWFWQLNFAEVKRPEVQPEFQAACCNASCHTRVAEV